MGNIYGLKIAPCQRILKDMYFLTLKGANKRAKEENMCGDYKGRGVTACKIGTYKKFKGFKISDEP